ncbi:glycoside hydrolase family 13 protein [Ferruginibacter sp.]
MKKIILSFFLFCISLSLIAQKQLEVYPGNWWAGMKMNKVQLIIHEKDRTVILAVAKLVVQSSSPDIKIIKVNTVENKRYLFVDVEIAANAKPQTVTISFGGIIKNEWRKFQFEIKPRRKNLGTAYAQGVTAKDFIYLLMPDRFSNGDESNDKFADMNDPQSDRSNPFLRHGGDLKGVENHLDYFKDLGVTALWLTPVIENNMHLTDEGGTKRSTYHGYAFTNHYQVDKRFGGNEAYKSMIDAAHKKGLKVIQDAVYNHVGNDHFFIKDMPMKDWVHQWPQYTNTTYKDQPLVDPYASAIDKKIVTDGWFTPFMPDLNQSNPYVSNFLIQNIIWSVEEFGIDGWRVDTYFYSDRDFLNKVNDALVKDFPATTVLGESTVSNIVNGAYLTKSKINFPFKHNAPGALDFTVSYAMLDALKQNFGWSEGVSKLYTALATDVVYENPMNNCIFFDNHDMNRYFSEIGEDINKYKTGLTWLLTLRGIPQMYYGTEILMKNFKDPTDAEVRKDFPGGWAADKENKFIAANRTAAENEAFDFVKKLANFRKTSSAITTGKLMQYVPQDGVYVYFRYNSNQTIMVIANTAKEEKKISFERFTERTKGFSEYKNVLTQTEGNIKEITLGAYQTAVLELVK